MTYAGALPVDSNACGKVRKMLKKLTIIMILVLSIAGLTACGPKSIEEVTGKEYECSQFTALCPEKWSNSPVKELNDSNTLSINHLRFYKIETEEGEELTGSPYSHAYVDIAHYTPGTKIFESREIYQNVEDVEVEINGVKWKGYTGELAGYKNGLLWKENGDGEWQVNICLSDEDGDVELEDYDFQAILASIKKK